MRLAVFVGTKGRGSNLMAIQQAILDGRLHGSIVAVIGTKAEAPALQRAAEAGLPTIVVPARKDDEHGYGAALLEALTGCDADTIALAGYLRKLPEPVTSAYRHRIVNVHPALLPAFGGKGMYGHHVHEAVLAYGAKVSGCTVHLVDGEYDTGPVIVQRVVPVLETDTPETLAARILPEEHSALIEALGLLSDNRLTVDGRCVRIREIPR